jgi:hypothetical protein
VTKAQSSPTVDSVTRDACVLTIVFTTYETGAHTLEIWDEGALIHSAGFEATTSPQQFTTTYTIHMPVGQGAIGYDYRVVAPSGVDSGFNPFDLMEIPRDVAQECYELYGTAGGCDLLLPKGSVVGTVLEPTWTYWAPSVDKELTPPLLLGTSPSTKTWWVLGQDSTHEWYKIAINCNNYVWVPADVMGPNYDKVWNGAPLPTRVVN